ncbi:MAG: BatA domain-containing protein [Planctomyces sp.]|nr:BatA domain-containing protein [Planctomyces sp.]
MSSWIAQHFLNSALFWPAVTLLSAPIIIHLINRLRFRRVRFAAMEFLLASEQRNRRRILLEHLLLLLARVAIVALIGLLVARFVADPRQLSLFQGAKAHHVVLLDDSGSMRDRLGERMVFDAAREVVSKLAAEGAQRPDTQVLTLLRMSRPEETVGSVSERSIDDALVAELTTRLEDLDCTYGTVDVAGALDAVRLRLADDASSVRHLHVVSDFRKGDWYDNKSAAAAIRAIAELDTTINLVRTAPAANANLGVVGLIGDVSAAAAGVPVTMTAAVRNFGDREAENVRLAVQVNGRPLPANLLFERIPAGEEIRESFEVVFETSGSHRVSVTLETDALEADNVRRLAVEVPEDNPVLIIDGSPGADQGRYIADALAADKSITGYATTVATADYLRRHPLDVFQAIYLVNLPELPEDTVDSLEKYVFAGGGLAWFLGDVVRPSFYNDRLYREGAGLFPTRLANAPAVLPRLEDATTPDIVAGDNALFRVLSGADNPFIDEVFVNVFYPVDEEAFAKDTSRPDGVSVLARLRNRAPLMVQHRFGAGRIITSLTAAGPALTPEGRAWTNWANGPGAPSFAVMQLELAKSIARRGRNAPERQVGEPIVLTLDRTQQRETVEIVGPDDEVAQLTATEGTPAEGASEEVVPLRAEYAQTQQPGYYTVTTFSQSQQPQQQVLAYNVPVEESALGIAEDAEIRRGIGEGVEVTIQPAGSFEWIRSESPGRELRMALLGALAAFLMLEQLMSYRLSYHGTGDSSVVRGRRGAGPRRAA